MFSRRRSTRKLDGRSFRLTIPRWLADRAHVSSCGEAQDGSSRQKSSHNGWVERDWFCARRCHVCQRRSNLHHGTAGGCSCKGGGKASIVQRSTDQLCRGGRDDGGGTQSFA